MNKKIKIKEFKYDGANWNILEDPYTQFFYEQNLSQFWRPEDISLQSDLHIWEKLTPEEKITYSRNLLILTFLDTYQGDKGMSLIANSFFSFEHQKKATLNFMGAMENAVHAKSYSNIFTTFLNKQEINQLFQWGENQSSLQKILNIIIDIYHTLEHYCFLYKNDAERENNLLFQEFKWKSMVASVFLETWLFYSGFYYPLYFYGQGMLMQAGEIINLIIRDESIHGAYVARLAKELYNSFSQQKQKNLKKWLKTIFQKLYKEQMLLTKYLYDDVHLTKEVQTFVRYNANKAFLNLGFEQNFPDEKINAVILNGLNTESKTMDFFSMKGNSYQKMRTESLKDEDFIFDN